MRAIRSEEQSRPTNIGAKPPEINHKDALVALDRHLDHPLARKTFSMKMDTKFVNAAARNSTIGIQIGPSFDCRAISTGAAIMPETMFLIVVPSISSFSALKIAIAAIRDLSKSLRLKKVVASLRMKRLRVCCYGVGALYIDRLSNGLL